MPKVSGEASAPDVFVTDAVDERSKLSTGIVDELQKKHVESGCDVKLTSCGPEERVNKFSEEGAFYVYFDHFRLGLSFPLCQELKDVLNGYGIVLAQMVPNSMASVMSFVVYLRRINHPWSLDFFRKHFCCRILAGGYAQFSTIAALKVKGLENKVRDWKVYFCKATAQSRIEIPRKPSSAKVPPSIKETKQEKESKKDHQVIELDIRQYVKDKVLLKRVLYPKTYGEMTAQDWEASDNALKRMPRGGPAYMEPEEGKNPIEFFSFTGVVASEEEEEEVLPVAVYDAGQTSASGMVGEEPVEDQPSILLSSDREEEEKTKKVSFKRKRVVNKSAKEKESAKKAPKVIISKDGKKAEVILDKEWFPASSTTKGVAYAMGSILESANLEARIREMPLSDLRDEAARHQAASWKISHYLGEALAAERSSSIIYEDLSAGLERENEVLQKKAKELDNDNIELMEKICNEEREHRQVMLDREEVHRATLASEVSRVTEEVKQALKKEHKVEVEALEEKHRQEMEALQNVNRELEKKGDDLEYDTVADIRYGISMCLDILFKHGVITSEWNDPEEIEKRIPENRASDNEEKGV